MKKTIITLTITGIAAGALLLAGCSAGIEPFTYEESEK